MSRSQVPFLREIITAKPLPVYAVPRPLYIPEYASQAQLAYRFGRAAARYWKWGFPAVAAAYWLTFPAMKEDTRRAIIPGYSIWYPAPPAEEK